MSRVPGYFTLHLRKAPISNGIEGPTILLVGTGHWGNPGADYKNPEFDDMLAPRHQREIEECVHALGAYAPTALGLEIQRHDEATMNQDYRAYRAGDFPLTTNELHQLGFRLAAAHQHERVHAVDWHHPTQPIGWDDAISFARHHDQQHLITFLDDAQHDSVGEQDRIEEFSVRELLLESNDMAILMESHNAYMDMVQIGSGDEYIGADVVLRWYERNMKIFVNITHLASSPDDRILVLIGGGHLPLLAHFIDGSGRFTRVEASSYLGSS